MGLFGLLCSLFTGGVYVRGKIRDSRHNEENRQKARIRNDITYIDSHGRSRLTSTGQQVFERGGVIRSNGKVILRPYLDYYDNLNKQRIAEAKEKGKIYAYLYHFKDRNDPDSVYCYMTEIDTMRQFKPIFYDYGGEDWYFYINYRTPNPAEATGFDYDSKQITWKEYKDVYGGRMPGMHVYEYRAQNSQRAKDLRKEINKIGWRSF